MPFIPISTGATDTGEPLETTDDGSAARLTVSDAEAAATLADILTEAKRIRIMLEHITGIDTEGIQ